MCNRLHFFIFCCKFAAGPENGRGLQGDKVREHRAWSIERGGQPKPGA